MSETDQDPKKEERETRERIERALTELREGAYRFASKVRGQAGVIIEELVDPEGETVACIADVEGDAGAIALSMPLDLITFDTWLFGQVGDQEELDLKAENHYETWFNFGAWIGEHLRRTHGGHWLLLGPDPHTWRLGFSKILLEVAPFMFAEQLLRLGSGALRRLVTEIERLRELHQDQLDKDGGTAIDRFTAQHYVRMHTVPLGQWMVMDFRTLAKLWNESPTSDLIREVKKHGARLGDGNAEVVTKVAEALGRADQTKPISQQTGDRGLFEAIAQIVALRRATAPIAIDILERMVMPALHVGLPESFPPLDDDDISTLNTNIELFAFFIDVVPHKYPADDEGFLRSIPHEHLSTPYVDKQNLEIGKGDWVLIDPNYFRPMLADFDSNRLLERYDEFLKYVASDARAPRRRDDGRLLAETVARSLADLRANLMTASKDGGTLVFRMLPPPG